jgi:hypothetical protein
MVGITRTETTADRDQKTNQEMYLREQLRSVMERQNLNIYSNMNENAVKPYRDSLLSKKRFMIVHTNLSQLNSRSVLITAQNECFGKNKYANQKYTEN